jgi:hypothetical protein
MAISKKGADPPLSKPKNIPFGSSISPLSTKNSKI